MRTTKSTKKIAIIGAGNVGKVLGYALKQKGYELAAISARTEKSREIAADLLQCSAYSEPEKAAQHAEIVFLTTPDRVIKEVCDVLALKGGFRRGQMVLHTSGAHSSVILSAAREAGAKVLSFHPLQTFPELEAGLRSLPGTFFAVEGDKEAFPVAEELVEALEGKMLAIPTEMKPLYHAAACVACNYLSTLMDVALRMYNVMGISSEQAFESLSPLIYGTLKNIGEMGPEKALTGPVARGDLPTIKSHLQSINELAPELLTLYNCLGIYTADLARRKGTLPKEQEEQLKNLLGG
ncbi:MAG: Rossmann-like and DUF2520 domain-containing protein [Dethiobacteria bacterium]|jgi:predicted short-subunit dehydrogenase-like oxidoreductase (DUF2520 family)